MSKEHGLQPWCFHVERIRLKCLMWKRTGPTGRTPKTHWGDFIIPTGPRTPQDLPGGASRMWLKRSLPCRHHDMDHDKWWKMDCGWMPECNAWLGLCKQVHQTYVNHAAVMICFRPRPSLFFCLFPSSVSKRLYSSHIQSHGTLDKCYLYIPPSSVDWSVCFLSWFTVCQLRLGRVDVRLCPRASVLKPSKCFHVNSEFQHYPQSQLARQWL